MKSGYQSLLDATGEVSRETFDDLERFEARFQMWNARINLASSSTLDDLWPRHILDSAQLWRLRGRALHWVDLGSGGGFPGLVIAFLLRSSPNTHIDLIESNRKKASFLQAIVGEFDLPAEIHASRIEDVKINMPDVVIARALAPLDKLLGLAEPWLGAGATGLFHKGRDYRAEIEESAHNWTYDLIEHRSTVDEDGVILEIGRLHRASDIE